MAEFTRKVARQLCRRRLGKIEESLRACALHWEDLDMSVIDEFEEMIRQVEYIKEQMDESVAEDQEA